MTHPMTTTETTESGLDAKALEAAKVAIYGRHERGFIMEPLIDPPDIAAGIRAYRAALPPNTIEREAEPSEPRWTEAVETAFINLCEALGIAATPAAYLDAKSALAALPTNAVETQGEPVAWMVRPVGSDRPWTLYSDSKAVDFYRTVKDGGPYEIVPLYAAPLPTPAGGVKVKPLEWLDAGDGLGYEGSWHADGAGEYSITLRNGVYEVFRSGRYPLVDSFDANKFSALAAAKAAAQSDYEARILSAIETTSAGALDPATVEACAKAPKPKVITRYTCEGCPCLETKDWSFEGENDDRDSGTDATCAATGRAIGNYWHAHHDAPSWCPALAAIRSLTGGNGND